MRKIPTLYVRDWEGNRSLVTREVTPGCEWVLKTQEERWKEDIWATKKHDGTCVLIGQPTQTNDGRIEFGDGCNYWKRYDAKHGKTPPPNFVPAQPSPDTETGHWPGWVPVNKNDKWHIDVMVRQDIFCGNPLHFDKMYEGIREYFDPGTYELCGPKVGGNPERLPRHVLFRHGMTRYNAVPTDGEDGFDNLRHWLSLNDIEGLVFYRNSGATEEEAESLRERGLPIITMCKIKKSDFGLPRTPDPEVTSKIVEEMLNGRQG